MNSEQPEAPSKSGFRDLITSVAGAAIGVQSSKVRERDFKSGSPRRYVIAGIIGTLLFVVTMYLVVQAVLRVAGA
jgi:hypothetical protein